MVHAEARYVFFPLILLASVGVLGVYALIQTKSRLIANITIGIFMVVTLYFGLDYYESTSNFFLGREANKSRNAYVEASEIIRKDSSTNECVIWATAFRPQISWYSGCNTLGVGNIASFKKNFLIRFRKSHYSIVFTKLESPQIKQGTAQEYGVAITEIYRSKKLAQILGELIVYRISDISIRTSVETYKELDHPYDDIYPDDVKINLDID